MLETFNIRWKMEKGKAVGSRQLAEKSKTQEGCPELGPTILGRTFQGSLLGSTESRPT